jgi:Tfp pilus assembly protein PilZ
MIRQPNPRKKYNVTISKLFQLVISLSEEQQLALLQRAEELLIAEKRINVRKSCNLPIHFTACDRVFLERIKNISSSGLFIETRRAFLAGDEIMMNFQLEGFDKPLKIKGEIVHATSLGVGVTFKNISKYVEEMLCLVVKGMK